MAPKRVDYVRDQRRVSHEVSLETPESEREPERERIGVLFEGDYASKVREIDDFIKVETFCDDESEFLRSRLRRGGEDAERMPSWTTTQRNGKEDIRRLEMTLEQLKLTLERAERQAKEEMERIGPVDEEEAFEDDDDDDDDDGGDSSTSAFVTLTKEQKRFCDDDETKEHHPRVTQNNLEESSRDIQTTDSSDVTQNAFTLYTIIIIVTSRHIHVCICVPVRAQIRPYVCLYSTRTRIKTKTPLFRLRSNPSPTCLLSPTTSLACCNRSAILTNSPFFLARSD